MRQGKFARPDVDRERSNPSDLSLRAPWTTIRARWETYPTADTIARVADFRQYGLCTR
jgi:hypothetical protein